MKYVCSLEWFCNELIPRSHIKKEYLTQSKAEVGITVSHKAIASFPKGRSMPKHEKRLLNNLGSDLQLDPICKDTILHVSN